MADYLQRVRAVVNDIGQGQRFSAVKIDANNLYGGFQLAELNVGDELELSFYSHDSSGIIASGRIGGSGYSSVFLAKEPSLGKVAIAYSDEGPTFKLLDSEPRASVLKIKRVSDGVQVDFRTKNESVSFKRVTPIKPVFYNVGNNNFAQEQNFNGYVWGVKKNGGELGWWEGTRTVEIEVSSDGTVTEV